MNGQGGMDCPARGLAYLIKINVAGEPAGHNNVMITAVIIAAAALASLLGIAIAGTLGACARRPRLVPVPARQRNKCR